MKSQKGFLSIVAVLFIVLLGFIGIAMASMFIGSANTTNMDDLSDQAFYIAVSGLEIAQHDLNKGATTCIDINGNSEYTNISLLSGQLTVTSTTQTASSTLSNNINATSTTIPLSSIIGFSNSGAVYIDSELIEYSGISSNNLTNVTRGSGGTLATSHSVSALVSQNACLIKSVAGVPTLTSPVGKRTVSGLINGAGLSFQLGSTTETTALTIGGILTMSGSSSIQNANVTASSSNFPGSTVVAGGVVIFSGSANTEINSNNGLTTSSSASGIKGDIKQSLSTLVPSTMFGLFFNQTQSAVQATANQSYNSSNINGATGQTISAFSLALAGNTTIGSPSSPVILIVNGSLSMSGNVNIYGFVFVTGTLSMSGNSNISGALGVQGLAALSGSSTISYNPAILSQLSSLNSAVNNSYSGNLMNLGEVFS